MKNWWCKVTNYTRAVVGEKNIFEKKRKTEVFLFALQDGLEPEYMKLTEIIRNYKKLNTNKLHKRIER